MGLNGHGSAVADTGERPGPMHLLGLFSTSFVAAALLRCAAERSITASALMTVLLCASAQLPLGPGNMSVAQRRDRALVMLLTGPCMNLVLFFFVPGFEVVQTSWLPALVLYHALICSGAVMLPPMHSFIHLTVSTAVFGFLDFHKGCKLGGAADAALARQSTSGSCPPLPWFILLKVLPTFAVALAVATLAYASSAQDQQLKKGASDQSELSKEQPNSSAQADDLQPRESASDSILMPIEHGQSVPFESLHIQVHPTLRSLLLRYHEFVMPLVELQQRTPLLFIIGVPTGLYFIWTLLMVRIRSLPLESVTSAEGLLLGMVSSFVTGREYSKLDLLSLVRHIQQRLAVSHSLLTDQLPAHIVKAALSRMATATSCPLEQEQETEQEEMQMQSIPAEPEQQRDRHAGLDVGQQTSVDNLEQRRHRKPPRSASALGPVRPASSSAPSSALQAWAWNRCVDAEPVISLGLPLSEEATSARWRSSTLLAGQASYAPTAFQSLEAGQLTRYSHSQQSISTFSTISQAAAKARGLAPSTSSLSQALASYVLRATSLRDLPWMPLAAEQTGGTTGTNSPDATVRYGSPKASHRATDVSQLDVMASDHASVTIFMSDICGFTTWSGRVEPAKVLQTLDCLYTRLDDVILHEFPSLYKVETIGDAYIVAANLLVPDPDHAATAVRFALRAREEASKVPRPDVDDGSTLQMRIGLHSGSISSGIVGKIRRRYVVYGDAMNMASRTETTCPPGCIQLTAATYSLALHALDDSTMLSERGHVQVKGREEPMLMYLAERSCHSVAAVNVAASIQQLMHTCQEDFDFTGQEHDSACQQVFGNLIKLVDIEDL